MANRANEYPDSVLCPLIKSEISADDCIIAQDCAEGMVKPEILSPGYTQNSHWRQICLDCKYHEID